MAGAEAGAAARAGAEPGWVEYAIWWQVYPLGFLGAPLVHLDVQTESTHRLQRLGDWLDYAIELGASGIALGPIFESMTHGYDTVDYDRIDSRLGDESDFRALVEAAHGRGLRVLLDGVFNHVGQGFPRLELALSEGPGSDSSRWFTALAADAGDSSSPRFATFEGHDALVELNHAEPEVADFVAEVMIRWLDRGADGWRLDAAYAVAPGFWAAVLPRVRAAHPDVYIAAEVLHGDYGAFVRASGVDAVTQYELWKAIWSSIHDANFFELAWAMQRHNDDLDTFAPLTFVGNHDVTRIASAVGDDRHGAHAFVILFTVGGTPSIYYGDEQSLHGTKENRAGGDDAVRPPYPESGPAGLPDNGWPTYRLHQELIGLRRRHPWLHRARTSMLTLTNAFCVYEARDDANRIVVALNLGDAQAEATVAGVLSVLAGVASVTVLPDAAQTSITVPPNGWAVLAGA